MILSSTSHMARGGGLLHLIYCDEDGIYPYKDRINLLIPWEMTSWKCKKEKKNPIIGAGCQRGSLLAVINACWAPAQHQPSRSPPTVSNLLQPQGLCTRSSHRQQLSSHSLSPHFPWVTTQISCHQGCFPFPIFLAQPHLSIPALFYFSSWNLALLTNHIFIW